MTRLVEIGQGQNDRQNRKRVAQQQVGTGRSSCPAIQTLIGTVKLNGIDPYAWLKDTLRKTSHLAPLQTG